MPNQLNETELIQECKTLFTNAAIPEIAAKLAERLYTETNRLADEAQLQQTIDARAAQQKEQAEAITASQLEDQIQATARSAFLQLHRLIRLADKTNPQLNIKSILQTGTLPQAEAAFITYTTNLLSRLQDHPQITAALAAYGLPPERIPELHTLIQNVQQADITQQQEQAQAKQATVIYQEHIAQLRLSHTILTALLKEALLNHPDLQKLIE